MGDKDEKIVFVSVLFGFVVIPADISAKKIYLVDTK